MSDKPSVDRRSVLKTAGSAAGLALLGSSAQAADSCTAVAAAGKKAGPQFKNEQFYDAQGKFVMKHAQDAILELCAYHGYPIFPGMREKLWISDYGVGQFTKVGLAGLMFVNNEEDHYMMLDIFLLPNQMLPEHWHVDGGKNPAKREGWLVRWGVSHIVGIGEPNLSKEVVIPKCHMNGTATVLHEVIATPGMFVPLSKVETRHWQFAGPEGAIITEVANVHTNPAVRHSDPVMNKFFLES